MVLFYFTLCRCLLLCSKQNAEFRLISSGYSFAKLTNELRFCNDRDAKDFPSCQVPSMLGCTKELFGEGLES